MWTNLDHLIGVFVDELNGWLKSKVGIRIPQDAWYEIHREFARLKAMPLRMISEPADKDLRN